MHFSFIRYLVFVFHPEAEIRPDASNSYLAASLVPYTELVSDHFHMVHPPVNQLASR